MVGLEVVTGLKKLTVHQCEELAKELDLAQKGERKRVLFDLCGPTGTLSAYWLDPWMGLFMIEGQEGFCTSGQFTYADVWCQNVRLGDTPAS